MKVKFSKRHLAKTLTWRFIATTDTIIIALLISGDLNSGLKIGGIEVLTKMILYYSHERIWFKTKFENARIRHLIKSFSWRCVGTIDTVIISGVILGNFFTGGKIGIIETITKIFLYYIHERLWYRIDYGLTKLKLRRKKD